ncbi:uncharacterized protein LOC134225047 isoform X2 [Armigeres subalbatus]|uniref:uncharacterized protein LOC134225047 isoform X2 n=1 Tax=Armigeres subalbatus TaxID=124917 RepID=UPI002ED06A6B
MTGWVEQLPNSKITQSVQLLVVLNLFLSFAPKNVVVADLPRLSGEKREIIRKYYPHHTARGTYDVNDEDVIRARRRLAAFMEMPPSVSVNNNNGNYGAHLATGSHPYSLDADLLHSPATRALGPIIVKGANNMSPEVLEDVERQECILGRAHHYMAMWLNPNGTINTGNSKIDGNFLDLSHNSSWNLLIEIRPFLGHHTSKLIFLSLAFSGITSVPRTELTYVNDTLTFLSMMGNVLIPFSLPVLHNLRVLDLRHCGFSSLPNRAFENTINLRKLFLAHNSFTRLSSLHFVGLSNLQHLDLSYVNQNSFADFMGHDQQIDPYNSLTEGLDLSEDVFTPLTNLTFLDVSYTKLLSYSARAFRNVMVVQLSLCYTGIRIIVGSMMSGTLKVLDISGNPGITTAIHHDVGEARGFNANLEILVCENSTVKNLDWLNGMISLRVLLLGTNNINQLTNFTFVNMERLEILDLKHNHISNWHQRVFERNIHLFILDLSINNINVLTTEMLYDFSSVEFLAIGQNNFVCHCLLREFIELAAKYSKGIACLLYSILNQFHDSSSEASDNPDTIEYLDDDIFSQDGGLNNNDSSSSTTTTTSVAQSQLTTALEKQPRGLFFTTEATEPLEVLDESESEYNVLFRVIYSYVSTVSDSTAKFQENADKYNRVRPSSRVYRKMVNSRMRTRFIRIDCDNDTDTEVYTDFPEDDADEPMFGADIILMDFDEESYKCIDLENSEYDLFEQERCTFDRTLLDNINLGTAVNSTMANIIKFSLICLGFVLVACTIYISKWEYIKYFCIIVRNATVLSLLRQKNETLLKKRSKASENDCYMYDVFVSYSEHDRQWVLDELLPNLEKTEEIAVCLHERDFQVGVSILENIIHCMDQSRTLLLVMSESFLLSHWCQFEMHLAQHRLLETRREQLILVMLEDIPKIKRSKTLQYLMKTKTYILWPQKHSCSNEESTVINVEPKKDKSKKRGRIKKQTDEKDPQSLVEERKLFWKRLRNAISEATIWEHDVSSSASGEDNKKNNQDSLRESSA